MNYKYIRWSIFFMTFVIVSLHLTVIVLNDHATTRVSEEIPDHDPHIWGAGPDNGGLCEMNWFEPDPPQNPPEEISCYVRSVINNLLRTPVNLYKTGDVNLYEVVGDANETALQKVNECGYGFDRTFLVPNELIARVCAKAKATNSNPASTNSFTILNILDYERSGIGLGRKDTAIDRHLSSFMFPGDYLILDVNSTIPNARNDEDRMGSGILEGRTTSTEPNARYFRLDYNHTLMLCLFDLPPDNILEVVLLDDIDRTSTFSDVDKSITENKITKSVNEWLNPLNKAFPKFPSTITAKVKAFLGRDGNTRIKNSGFKVNSQTYIETQFGSGATVGSILQVAKGTRSSSSSNLKKVMYVHMENASTDQLAIVSAGDNHSPLILSISENFSNRSDKNFACVTGSLHMYKHEIGHMLHMEHYYQGRFNSANEMLSFTSLPSYHKPVPVNKCSFDVPYTVMYTEPKVTDLDAAFVQHMWAYMYNGTKYPSESISDPKNNWASRVNVFNDSGSPDPNQWVTPFHEEDATKWNKRPKGTNGRIYYFDMFMKRSLPFDIVALLFNVINLYLAFRRHSSNTPIYMKLWFFLPTSIIGTILIGGLLSTKTETNLYRYSLILMGCILLVYLVILGIDKRYPASGVARTRKWVPIVIMMQTIALNITYYVFVLERHNAWEECKQSGEAFHSDNIEIILYVIIALSVMFLLMCLLYFGSGLQNSGSRTAQVAPDDSRAATSTATTRGGNVRRVTTPPSNRQTPTGVDGIELSHMPKYLPQIFIPRPTPWTI